MKKTLLFKAFALVLTSIFAFNLASCTNPSDSSSISEVRNERQEVKVVAYGDIPLKDVAVELYDGNVLKGSALTDEKGLASVPVARVGDYSVKLSGLQPGYYMDGEFSTLGDGNVTVVECKTKLAEGNISTVQSFSLGQIMYDFTVPNSEGEDCTISSYFENGCDVLLLNFWYVNCGWCVKEFPVFQEAYEFYEGKIEILALNPYDDTDSINAFKARHELTFDMAIDYENLTTAFGVTGFPTTVVIDRYGSVAMIASGAVTSFLDFKTEFEPFLAEDYKPDLGYVPSEDDGGGQEYPLPTVSAPEDGVVKATIADATFDGELYHENPSDTESTPYNWPWVVSSDGKSIETSNVGQHSTFSALYGYVNLKKDQVLAFDYFISTELYADILYIFINDVLIHELSGISDDWTTCYAYVPLESGKYEISLIYNKDYDTNEGNDIVSIKNLRVQDASTIDKPTYIIRDIFKGYSSMSGKPLFTNTFFNSEDGYYHVNSETGPLVLADLTNSTLWSEYAINDLNAQKLFDGLEFTLDEKVYKVSDVINEFVFYVNNSAVPYVPVTEKLKQALVTITGKYSNDIGGDKEWLTMCNYFSAYGTNGKELEDPIKGLAPFNAYEANLGDDNYITFTSTIVPRGKFSSFTPEVSGVYKIQTLTVLTGDDYIDASLEHETDIWIFTEDKYILAEASKNERDYILGNDPNAFLYYYMEANQTYYINCAFSDLYRYTDLRFSIEYMGESYSYLAAGGTGYFTSSDVDESGMPMGEVIGLTIDVELDETDNFYYAKNADGSRGSKIYCDFDGENQMFNRTITEMIENEIFVFNVNGETVDYNDRMRAYADKVIKSGEFKGLVEVDKDLAEVLQLLMDEYTLVVDESWLKICYYYKTIDANNNNVYTGAQ